MRIEEKTLKRWLLMRREGDIKELQEITGAGRPTLIRVFKTGRAKKLLFQAIDKFYKERARELLEAINN